MKLCQVLGGLSLVEADDVRKAMVKKKYEALHQYKERFIPNYVKEFGVTQEYSENVWGAIDRASTYLFNKSHAAAYAITGYIGQWLKYYYPLQYWTSAFQFDDPNPKTSSIGRYISEIRRTDNFIKITPPNINESGRTFTSNPEKMELYWSIDKVKQLGDKALEAIISEREKTGEFFSLEEFLERVEKRVVNKAVTINLILSGAFDELESVAYAGDRKRLINKYYEITGTKRDEDDIFLGNHEDYWWQIKQKEACSFGNIDFEKIIKSHTGFKSEYVDGLGLQQADKDKGVVAIGVIKDFKIRTTKRDDEFCKLILDNNNEDIDVTIWSDTFDHVDREELIPGKIFIMDGRVAEYRGVKTIHSYEKSKIYFI